MSQNRDWRVILKEIEEEKNSKNDSLELGDSWRAMPHRIEGATNKTNGLYRRSALPAQSVNNLYNFIIEKQPTNGKKATDSVKDAPVTQPLKLLIPNVQAITPKSDKSSDSMDFSKFLSEPTDGHKAVTSTPYPVRQTDANKSPRGTMNVQRNVADSPNKLFVPAPTRIPISTPRTSRLPSDADRRAKQPSDRKKMPSPTSVVSSTVHIVSDDEESDAAKSPEQQIRAPSNRILAVTEDADQNRPPIDEDQQKQDAGTNNADEAVFRRPDVVRRPLVKPIKLELDDDQSKMSNSQRNKKPKSMMNPLLESYIKVGESINNRTNSIPLENSSSSSRRRLYKKGDSCNEEDILKDVVPLEQPSFVLNPVSAGDNGTFTKAKSISAQSNAVEGDTNTGSDAIVETAVQDPKATDEPQPQAKESAAPPQSGTEQNNIINRTFDCEPEYLSPLSDDGDESTSDGQNQSAISNESESNDGGRKSLHAPAKSDAPSNDDVAESTNDVQSATANKKQVDDAENNLPKANSSDQQNHMSAKHSSKQVLAEILGDWSDTVKPTNDKDGVDPSMSNDSDSEVHSSDIKQPSTESKVRQARSQSKKSQNTGTASSKTRRRGAVRSDLKQIDEDRETDEDELSTTSAIVRNETRNASHANKGNKRTGTQVSTKTKNESAHSAQQEVAEIEYSDSDGDEQIAEEPSIIKLPRTKKQQRDAAKSRSKKEDIETAGNEVALRSKSKRKPVANGSDTDTITTSKAREKKTRDEDDVLGTDDETEDVLPGKPKGRQTRQKDFNVEDDVIEADGRKTKLVATSKGKKTNADVKGTNVIDPELATTSKGKEKKKRKNAEEDEIEAEPATTSKGKEKKKRGNAEEDVPGEDGIETEPTTTSKRNRRNKRGNADDDVPEEVGIEAEPATTSKGKEKKKRGNAEEDVPEEYGIETEPTTTSKRNQKKKKLGTVDDVAGTELAAASKSKGKKKRSNAEDEVTESDVNEAALPKTSQPKTRKKNLDAEDNTTEERDEPQIEIDDSPARVRSTPKPNVRKSQKRKHQSIADARSQSNDQRGNFSSRIDGSMATKRRKLSRWERKRESHCFYNSLKPREVVPGVRQSTRERRMPTSNLLFAVPISANSSNRSALQRQNGRTVQPKMRLTQSANGDGENVFSMLLNGSMDKEPPLITNLDGIEITQGFHKTVKNNLVIHHIPGETGPSYGYFTLEPGMVKRPCRISWNLHIHVVSGPIHIFTNGKSEQMVTGSFASLHSGTKYSLRNDGENSALVFFSQQANEQPKID
ncbi:uncharacterized protein LOC119070683 isoform X2 [Bradysia coprophila]|uniref:uncharacterized protein LOC119070683 isoform X2 n=1 Tax=Bradysia coprophila TaxID=38358 RepID=UPI00187DA9A1|nr:uncharacterized protein LOC119070683 isoform X2 [Bradysia coprophila]